MDHPSRAEEARTRAEARFKANLQRRTDADKAMAEVEANRVAERDKTARLRALRLAKEEADRTRTAAAAPVTKGASRTAAARKLAKTS
jgi:hypothetical protein